MVSLDVCNWRNKIEFGACLEATFLRMPADRLVAFLRSHGFGEAEPTSDGTRYFMRTTRTMSGYRVAVLIRVGDSGDVQEIRVR